MKFAIVTYEYPPDSGTGGIGTYTIQLSRLLAAGGITVHIFAAGAATDTKITGDGIVVHKIKCNSPQLFKTLVVPAFTEEHEAEPFQYMESPEIHANGSGIKEKFPNLPMIVRLHAPDHLVESLKKTYVPFAAKMRFVLGALKRGRWDAGFWRRYYYQNDEDYLFAKGADHILAPSVQMYEWALKNWQLKPELLRVLPNPVILDEAFTNAATENLHKNILFYGRLNVLKGLRTATIAMKQVLTLYPRWQWTVIGADGLAADGKTSMRQWMKDQLKEVAGQVVFVENVGHDEIASHLAAASIVLVPSLFESYSYVTIESMSAGKAVVGSKGTGIASLVEDGVNGLLADPSKPAQWIKQIMILIRDVTLRQRLGKAAFETARQKELENKNITRFYTTLLDSKPKIS